MVAGNSAKRAPPDAFLRDPLPLASKSTTPAEYDATPAYQNAKAIVLDFGSHTLRAGYSCNSQPNLLLPPYVARMKDPETGIRTFLTGQEALISSARSTARPAYETGVPSSPGLMERLLDGTLVGLGLANEERINYPFVMTEAPCQPNSARGLLMELIFEAYEAPSVCFGIDALFSYYYNRGKGTSFVREDGVILSCGFNNTHVLPITQGRLEPRRVNRINIGGYHMTDQLTRRLQLIHPEHSSVLTPARVELLKEELCYVSKDYVPELYKIQNEVDYYNEVTKNVKVPMGDISDKPKLSPEEEARRKRARIANGVRLSEMMREKRKNKEKESGEDAEDSKYTEDDVKDLNDALSKYYELRRIEEVRDIDEDKFYFALRVREFDSPESFNLALDARQQAVEAEREKLGEAKSRAAETAWFKKEHENELLSLSDSELSAAQQKRKRHIRTLRLAAAARDRAKKAREAAKAAEAKKEEERMRAKAERPEEYLANLRKERAELAAKIKKRKAAREAGSDRRSQAARERMRLLAQHAGNNPSADEPGKGRGKGRAKGRGKGRGSGRGRGRGGKRKATEDADTFGKNDSDWDVYRSMRVRPESDSDDNSEEERQRLQDVRDEISEMQPDEVDPTLSRPEGVALLYEENKYVDEFAVTVDRLRTPELIFQPTIAGVEQCGVMEALRLAAGDRRSIVQEVFLTGGVAKMNGLRERVCAELRRMYPSEWGDEIERGVRLANDPSLDGWNGAAKFAESGGEWFKQACISKLEFEEMGTGYLKEHALGNVFFKTPILTAADLELKKKLQKQASKRGRSRSMYS